MAIPPAIAVSAVLSQAEKVRSKASNVRSSANTRLFISSFSIFRSLHFLLNTSDIILFAAVMIARMAGACVIAFIKRQS